MITLADCLEANEVQAAPVPGPDPHPDPTVAPPKKRGGGPKTEAGKQSSRWNAYQHGMRAKVLMPDDLAAAVAERKDDLLQEFSPDTPYQEWLVGEMALAATRLDRVAMLSIADLQRTIDRAELCWDKDRRIAAEDLGVRLSKQPSRVKLALEASKHGADFLRERWEGLGAALKAKGCWDDDQRKMAFDLLGVPPALRDGGDKVPPASDAEGLARLVAKEVARLRREREESLDELDLGDRAMAASGFAMSEDAETARLRKYEGTCRRALLWAHHELRRVRGTSLTGLDSSSGSEGSRDLLPPPRSSLSKAALEFMAGRAEAFERAKFEIAVGRADEDEGFAIDDAELEAAIVAPPAQAKAFSSASMTPKPRNRHERRAQERRNR